ncbi:hypothetical protein [Thalassotalea piscium]|uniref:SGNH/GDSL hydrolase family protein n=1 Tax=Thalassotalea piscium TaxID=1230533 RepID=A0A7X0TTG1_9GAMM|nr:hypothetical protein [Thalassotalea piscium]MBB6543089.1 hypothetical protein [Thalassotalea piscium]
MRYSLYFSFGVVLSFLVFYALWLSNTNKPSISTSWISQFYKQKTIIAQSTKKPKILITSGSNSLFAFDSERLSNVTTYEVVNYAVAVGLGLRYILEQTKQQLQPGDVVLLPLEYTLYEDKYVPDKTLPLHLLENQDYYRTLNWFEQFKIILFTPLSALLQTEQIIQSDFLKDLYNPERMNEYGDIGTDSLSRIYMQYQVEKYSLPDILPKHINNRSAKMLTEYVEWAKSSNIKVIAMPPAVNYSASLSTDEAKAVKRELKSFWTHLGVSFVGDFEMFEFNKPFMFENPYHLNHKGRQVFMDKLLSHFLDIRTIDTKMLNVAATQ